MRKLIAAVIAASILVVPGVAQAATSSQVPDLRTQKSALRKDVKRALKRVRKLDLSRVEAKGFTLKRVRALVAGKASATAKVGSVTVQGAASVQAKGRTVAKGSRRFAQRGRASVKLRASRSGKRLMRKASRITLTVKVVFKSGSGDRVGAKYKVTLKRKGQGNGTGNGGSGGQPPNESPGNPAPPVATGPIPANAQLQYFHTFDAGPSFLSGLSPQCSGTVQAKSEAGDGYAHLDLPADAGQTAGLERCEVSFGGYDHASEPGEYWYRSRMRLGIGFPFTWGAANFVTLQQWQEDRPAAGGGAGNPVDGALFVNSGPGERMYVRGQRLPISQSTPFDINAWHNFIVHGVWTDQPNGYLEWWIDGTYVGKTTGVTSESGGRHFWKGGITRSDDINIDQSADIANFEVWKMP
jgi:hypothetical protein